MQLPGAVARLVSHWTPLPEFGSGRSLLACYATVEELPELAAVAQDVQRQLADLPQFDLIDRRWLHCTVQGVGFTDELPGESLAQLAMALAPRLRALPQPEVRVEAPVVADDSVLLPLRPVEGLARVREAVQAAAAEALGLPELYALPGQDDDEAFDPHVTVAYCNGDVDARTVRSRLAALPFEPLRVTLRSFTVLELVRTHNTWEWTGPARLPVGKLPELVPSTIR